MKEKIAFVVQRYGEEVVGGSEAECRMYAERMTEWYDVDVITTCANDYLTWKNEYAPGESLLNGVTVRRFPVERERDTDSFGRVSARIREKDGRQSREDEDIWLREQGPCSEQALRYLREHGGEYRVVYFMTYLYYLTAAGLPGFRGRSILIPTAHDEWPIYLSCFREVFEAADALVYNSEAERRFTDGLFLETAGKPWITVGSGVEQPTGELPDIRERFGLTKPYILYSGRIDPNKGCDRLFEYFELYKKRFGGELELVLTGKADMPVPQREDVRPLGFVSEEEKYAVMAGAQALVLASRFESLSIVVLESMMMGRPVLVNGECEVLRDHVLSSGAGLYFCGGDEFCGALRWLLTHPAEYELMRENGKKYVAEQYRWDVIMEKMHRLTEEVLMH